MKPLGNKIQLEIEELKFGAIQSESISECGKIIAVGERVAIVKGPSSLNVNTGEVTYRAYLPEELIGKTLYFKAWAVDIITDPEDGKKYYFISADSDAICAIK